jgi:hypothetical protein
MWCFAMPYLAFSLLLATTCLYRWYIHNDTIAVMRSGTIVVGFMLQASLSFPLVIGAYLWSVAIYIDARGV